MLDDTIVDTTAPKHPHAISVPLDKTMTLAAKKEALMKAVPSADSGPLSRPLVIIIVYLHHYANIIAFRQYVKGVLFRQLIVHSQRPAP